MNTRKDCDITIIHTAEYTADIKPTIFLSMLRTVKNTDYIGHSVSKSTTDFKELGFTKITILARLHPHTNTKHITSDDIMRCYIKARVNFSKLTHLNNKLFSGNEKQIEKCFNNALYKINSYLPLYSDFRLRRLDYAIDLHLPSKDYITYYLRMFRKAGQNNYFTSCGAYKTSISIHTKSYNYNFYDKGEERQQALYTDLKQLGYSNITDEELKNTTNVLRVEIQCKKNKLKRIEKKNNKLIDFNTSYNFILNDIERNFKTGSCYKFKYFKETVIPYLFKSRTKQQNAINLLQYIRRSGHTVRQAIQNAKSITGITPQTARNTLKAIHEYKGADGYYTCVIPLQERATVNYLPDITPIIKQEFAAEKGEIINY